MRVSEAMTGQVRMVTPDQTLQDAAQLMNLADIGALPVGENDRLVGMITDRDIAIRAVAAGKGPLTPVHDVMTDSVKYCFEDEDIDHVARNMGDQQIRRLPVLNREKRLVGMLALGDIAVLASDGSVGKALSQISRSDSKDSPIAFT